MFPFEAMPRPAQWLSQALPLTHFLRIVRGITLKGAASPTCAASSSGSPASWRVLVLLASLRFSKKLV